jgi:hypothetical protein
MRGLLLIMIIVATVLAGCMAQPQYIAPLNYAPANASPGQLRSSYDDLPRSEQPNMAIYYELLGNGVISSLNFEVIIDTKVTARFGGLCLPSNQLACPWVAPMMIGYLYGDGPSKLEIGVGALWVWNQLMHGYSAGQTATVAWRWQPKHAGMMWKAGWTPIIGIGPAQNETAWPWMGVATGYTW